MRYHLTAYAHEQYEPEPYITIFVTGMRRALEEYRRLRRNSTVALIIVTVELRRWRRED